MTFRLKYPINRCKLREYLENAGNLAGAGVRRGETGQTKGPKVVKVGNGNEDVGLNSHARKAYASLSLPAKRGHAPKLRHAAYVLLGRSGSL